MSLYQTEQPPKVNYWMVLAVVFMIASLFFLVIKVKDDNYSRGLSEGANVGASQAYYQVYMMTRNCQTPILNVSGNSVTLVDVACLKAEGGAK